MMNKWGSWIFLIILIAAIGLQLTGAWQKSFWVDEAYTADVVQRNMADIGKEAAEDVHPPLFIFVLALWGRIFGYTELGLRSLSIIFVALSIILTYVLTRDILGQEVGLIATGLLAFSPLFLLFGNNARYYAMATVFGLLVTWSMVRYLQSKRLVFLLLYILACTSFLYLLFAAVIFIAGCNVWWLIQWIREKRPITTHHLYWLLSQFIILGLYIPGFKMAISVAGRFAEVVSLPNIVVELVKRTVYFSFVFSLGETLSPVNPLALLGIIAVAIAAGAALILNRRKKNFWLPVIIVLLVGFSNILLTVFTAVSQNWQNLPYRALYLLPFLMMWFGAGLAALKRKFALVLSVLIALAYCAGLMNYFSGEQFLRPIFTVPWRTIFSQIQSKIQPGGLVICDGNDWACGYYAARYGFDRKMPSSWSTTSQPQILDVWWIKTNLSVEISDNKGKVEILGQIRQSYPESDTYNYAPLDPSIRWLKGKLFHQQDFEYRVNVFRFYNP